VIARWDGGRQQRGATGYSLWRLLAAKDRSSDDQLVDLPL